MLKYMKQPLVIQRYRQSRYQLRNTEVQIEQIPALGIQRYRQSRYQLRHTDVQIGQITTQKYRDIDRVDTNIGIQRYSQSRYQLQEYRGKDRVYSNFGIQWCVQSRYQLRNTDVQIGQIPTWEYRCIDRVDTNL